MKDRSVRPSVTEPFVEDGILIEPEQKQARSDPLNMYSFRWLWHRVFAEPEEASLPIGRKEVIEVYLTSRRAERQFRDECNMLFLKWFNRWRQTKEGRRKFDARLKKLKDESPNDPIGELERYAMKDSMLTERFGRIYEDRVTAERKRLARLSIDPNLLDFQYLSPPVTCSSEGITTWARAICWPFGERLNWNEADWAHKVLQEVGCLGRMIQARELNTKEAEGQLRKLYRVNPPGRLESTAELREPPRVLRRLG
jgi:hypothetical protein